MALPGRITGDESESAVRQQLATRGKLMTRKQKLCDICHEPITQLGRAAMTMKIEPVDDRAICNPDFPAADFMTLCQKNYHTDEEFIAAGYLPPEWVRGLLDLQETRCS